MRKSFGEIFLLEELYISEKQRFLATVIKYSYGTYLSARMGFSKYNNNVKFSGKGTNFIL